VFYEKNGILVMAAPQSSGNECARLCSEFRNQNPNTLFLQIENRFVAVQYVFLFMNLGKEMHIFKMLQI
jgi:hypothetical protein